MRSIFGKTLSTFVLLAAVPAIGQNGPARIDAPANSIWQHQSSGISFPVSVGGLDQRQLMRFSEGDWDVAARYSDAGQNTIVTIFVYEAAEQDAALWFAEARKAIGLTAVGALPPTVSARAFSPPMATTASGMRAVWPVDGVTKSTALAIAPLGDDWLVKLRISSNTLSVEQMNVLLDQAIVSVAWKTPAKPHMAAKEVANCTDHFPKFKKARAVGSAGESAILSGLFGSIVNQMPEAEKNDVEEPQKPYCRDTDFNLPTASIYRRDTESYMMTLGDSGRAIFVFPDELASVLQGKKKPTYTINMIVPGETLSFRPRNNLPAPAQLLGIVQKERWTSSVSHGKGNTAIEISSDALK